MPNLHTVVQFAEGEYYNTIPCTLRAKRVLEVTATRLYDSMVRYNRDAKRRKRLATAPGYRRRLGTGDPSIARYPDGMKFKP